VAHWAAQFTILDLSLVASMLFNCVRTVYGSSRQRRMVFADPLGTENSSLVKHPFIVTVCFNIIIRIVIWVAESRFIGKCYYFNSTTCNKLHGSNLSTSLPLTEEVYAFSFSLSN